MNQDAMSKALSTLGVSRPIPHAPAYMQRDYDTHMSKSTFSQINKDNWLFKI